MNCNKNNNCAFNSEELAKTDFKKEIIEFDNIKIIENKNKLFISRKSINVKNNNSNNCLNNSIKRNNINNNYKKENKIYITDFVKEKKKCIQQKINKQLFRK